MDALQRRASLISFLVLFALAGGLLAWTVSGFLLALFMAQLLAFLLAPIQRRLTRLAGGRARLAAALSTALLLLGVLGPLAGFGALAVREGIEVSEALAKDGPFTPATLLLRAGPLSRILGQDFPEQARLRTRAAGKQASLALLRWVRRLPHLGLELMLVFVAVYFLLPAEDRAIRLLLEPLPLPSDLVDELVETIRSTATLTLWAALAAATLQTLALMAAFLLLRVPLAFLAGGLAFLAAWVPMISSAPVWLAGAAYLWSRGATGHLGALCAAGAVTYVLEHFVRPIILGGRGRLHPLLGLMSLLGGLLTYGLAGVFVGPVIASLATSLYALWPVVAARSGIKTAAAGQSPLRPGRD